MPAVSQQIPVISLIVPVYNEHETIGIFYEAVRQHLATLEAAVEIVFVNDGSADDTQSIIEALAAKDSLVRVYSFTRNFGKEAALFCGLEHCTGDCAIPIDVDLQDPIELIPQMVERWRNGFDAILAKRSDRSSDGFLKRKTAEWFYAVFNAISERKLEPNVGDFRLISRSTIDAITSLPERNLFMKGVLGFPGGKTDIIEYRRAMRSAGSSKFNGLKLLNLAIDGITSFSTVPLRVWTYIGGAISAMSFLYLLFAIVKKLAFGDPVQGYASLLCVVLCLGGIQLIGLGILGEYIGRIYKEVKHRPRYVLKAPASAGKESE